MWKKRLAMAVPAEHRHGFELEIYRDTLLATVLVGVAVLLFEAAMMVSTVLRSGPLTSSPTRLTYFYLYLSLFLVTLACLSSVGVLRRKIEAHPAVYRRICLAYGCFICLWASCLTAFSHRNDLDISVFLYVELCVAMFIVMKPWQSALLYGVNQCAFILLAYQFIPPGTSLFSSAVNTVIATLLAIIISSTRYHSRVKNYLNQQTILSQNDQIRVINAQLEQLSLTDALTQVHNRRYLETELPARLEEARARGEQSAVLMIDIDHFKQYNDIYGHQQGDECLRRIAAAIGARAPSGYLVRYGGEEFVVLLIGVDEREAVSFAQEMRVAVAGENITHAGSPLGYATISVGVCHSPGQGASGLSQMVHYADEALYRAKLSGRDRVELFSGVAPRSEGNA